MLLFIISFLLVFGASYLIASCLNKEKNILGLLYIFILSFANIVFTFELLSLFSAITQAGILAINSIALALSIIIWKKQNCPIWNINPKPFFKKVWLACLKDKYLFLLGCAYLFLIFVTLFDAIIIPAVNPDASCYHMLRSLFFISNHNLNHFDIADYRAVAMPINSEILYAWMLIFIKKVIGIGFISFSGYVISIICVNKFMELLKIAIRPRLWTIFILSSLPAIMVQMTSSETDIIIAGLITSSILMYWYAIKGPHINKIPIFMAALSYALAIGTKTPALIAIPAVGVFLLFLSVYYLRKNFYKPLILFIGFGLINFVCFAAYNYVLNFISFGSIKGPINMIKSHTYQFDIKLLPANIIKHFFLFADFTGFRWGEILGDKIIALRDGIIQGLNLPTIENNLFINRDSEINYSLRESSMGFGILGIILYLFFVLINLIKPLICRNKKTIFLSLFALTFVLNIVAISSLLVYMTYSTRFMVLFVVISAPILAISYSKKSNLYKLIVTIFALYYLIFVAGSLWSRPFFRIIRYFKTGSTINQVRELSFCSKLMPDPNEKAGFVYYDCQLKEVVLNNIEKGSKILYLPNRSEELLSFKMLDFYGYKIDTALLEKYSKIDFSKYDYVITKNNVQYADLILNFKEGITPMFNTTKAKGLPPEYNVGCMYFGGNLFNTGDDYFESNPHFVKCKINKELMLYNGFEDYQYLPIKFNGLDGIEKKDINQGAFVIYKKL